MATCTSSKCTKLRVAKEGQTIERSHMTQRHVDHMLLSAVLGHGSWVTVVSAVLQLHMWCLHPACTSIANDSGRAAGESGHQVQALAATSASAAAQQHWHKHH